MKRAWAVRSAQWVRIFDRDPTDAEIAHAIRTDREPLGLVISVRPMDKDPIQHTRLIATVPFLLEHGLIDQERARLHLEEVLRHRRPKDVRVVLPSE